MSETVEFDYSVKISRCFGFDEIFGDRDLIVEVGFGSVRWNWVFPGIGILQIQDHGGWWVLLSKEFRYKSIFLTNKSYCGFY